MALKLSTPRPVARGAIVRTVVTTIAEPIDLMENGNPKHGTIGDAINRAIEQALQNGETIQRVAFEIDESEWRALLLAQAIERHDRAVNSGVWSAED